MNFVLQQKITKLSPKFNQNSLSISVRTEFFFQNELGCGLDWIESNMNVLFLLINVLFYA